MVEREYVCDKCVDVTGRGLYKEVCGTFMSGVGGLYKEVCGTFMSGVGGLCKEVCGIFMSGVFVKKFVVYLCQGSL